jgi:hypothetical protein
MNLWFGAVCACDGKGKVSSVSLELMPSGRDSGSSVFVRRRSRLSPLTPFPSTSPSPRVGNPMISPRGGNYERLEGGLGPSRLGMRSFAWRKIALCLTITVGVLWLLRPSKEISLWPIKTPREPPPQTFTVVGVENVDNSVENTRET